MVMLRDLSVMAAVASSSDFSHCSPSWYTSASIEDEPSFFVAAAGFFGRERFAGAGGGDEPLDAGGDFAVDDHEVALGFKGLCLLEPFDRLF